MNITFENDYIVFDVNDGPKKIIETLNSKGLEGWTPVTSINVGGMNIVFFLTRPSIEVPESSSESEKKLNKLWGTRNE
tara:strand:+ start:494 stop:727 length:234 start_codon:yes stop_codon:yes gene_type:complete